MSESMDGLQVLSSRDVIQGLPSPTDVVRRLQETTLYALLFALRQRAEDCPGLFEFIEEHVVVDVSLEPRRRGVLGYFCEDSLCIHGLPVCKIYVSLSEIVTLFKPGQRADQVFDTTLHEAAHAWGFLEGIETTSRQGRWHNFRFRDIAEALGLRTEHTSRVGYTTLGLAEWAKREYAEPLAELEAALVLDPPAPRLIRRPGSAAAPGQNLPVPPGQIELPKHISATCGCDSPRRIRVATGSWTRGPIRCDLCSQPFRPTDGALSTSGGMATRGRTPEKKPAAPPLGGGLVHLAGDDSSAPTEPNVPELGQTT